MRVGILTEFPSPSIQSGPALQTRLLHDGLQARGHFVVLVGPDTSSQSPVEAANTHLFANASFAHGPPGRPRYPARPTINIPMPWPPRRLVRPPELDVLHSQCTSHITHYGAWLRKLRGTAFINTNVIHLPAHIHFLLPDRLRESSFVWQGMQRWVLGIERSFAELYNQGDGLIVQTEYLVDYWIERGVRVPIEVIGRPIDPTLFSRPIAADPFPANMTRGKRLLCVCRIDREKNLDMLVELFDREIAENDPQATLTILGDGFERQRLILRCGRSRHASRFHFPGEIEHERLRDWYAHADVFVYTSLSETFGNVVNEALWNGLPVVALNDRLGVAHQVKPGVNGFLIDPERPSTTEDFAATVLSLFRDEELRTTMAREAERKSRRTSHPDVVLGRYERFYEQAIQRARREVGRPLAEARGVAKAAGALPFARHIGAWALWSSLVVGLGRATVAFGIGEAANE